MRARIVMCGRLSTMSALFALIALGGAVAAPSASAELAQPRLGTTKLGETRSPASKAPEQKPPASRSNDGKGAAGKPGETKPSETKTGGESKTVSEFGSSKEPIAIDADRLDVYDKDGRAVFTGNVVAVQGDTTMKCSVMNVSYEKSGNASGGAQPAAAPGGLAGNSSVKKIDCAGPVTITTKTQTATGDRAEFDRVANKVYLIGNAVLTDGPNVTRGGRVAYDLTTSIAAVEGAKQGDRVRALIVPGSDKDKEAPGGKPKTRDAEAKPRPR